MRRRQRRSRRLRIRFWALSLVASFVVLAQSFPVPENDAATCQTMQLPIPALEIDSGRTRTDVLDLVEAKHTLTAAYYRLLRSKYGDCVHNVKLDISLEQSDMPTEEDVDLIIDVVQEDDAAFHRSMASANVVTTITDKTLLTAKGSATFQCETERMSSISIAEIAEVVRRGSETLQHIATVVFEAKSDSFYHSLVKIAFGTCIACDDGDLAVSSSRNLVDPSTTKETQRRLLCLPQIDGKIRLRREEYICSSNGLYSFGMSKNGDLCLRHGSTKVWSARTRGTFAIMQVDGNLVVRSSSYWPVWASGTSENRHSSLRLDNDGVVEIISKNKRVIWRVQEPLPEGSPSLPGDSSGLEVLEGENTPTNAEAITCVEQIIGKIRLYIGEFLCSRNKRFYFGLSDNGDLALYDQDKKLWSAGTCCSGQDTLAKLQKDGNLVVYTISGDVLWTSKTVGAGPDSALFLGDDGVVSIFDDKGRRVWSARGIPESSGDYYESEEFNKLQGNSNSEPLSVIGTFQCLDQVEGKIFFAQGTFICSPDQEWMFGVDNTGDLSLWQSEITKIWSAETAVGETTSAKLSQRGNLIVKVDATNEILWTSKTSNNINASLVLDNDGVASIVTVDGISIWTANEQSPPSPSPTPELGSFHCVDQVAGKIVLFPGEFICSPDDVYRFGLSFGGDLSLWTDSIMLWSADSDGGAKATLQVGGNLVIRDELGHPIWTSKTSNNPGASLVLGNDGVANIVSIAGLSVWTTSTPFTDRGGGGGISTFRPTPSPVIVTSPPVHAATWGPSSNAPTTVDGCISLSGTNKIVLNSGHFVCSPSGRFKFGLDLTGDLSLWRRDTKIWSAATGASDDGAADIYAKLRDDGNLVVRNTDMVLWSSDVGVPDAQGSDSTIEVHDDGIATITSSIGFHIWSSAASSKEQVVDPSTLTSKVMAGYQGWFYTDNDGGLNRWIHWSDARTVPSKSTITIDMWPDMREYDADELAATEFKYKDGSNAGLYSSYQTKTVERHCKWLQDYGVDGLFVQRFVADMLAWPHIRDQVLHNVRSGSEKHGRVFVNMYDISNGDQRTLVDDIKRDWMHLVDDEQITSSKSYLHHKGRPIVAIWGFGFNDRIGTPSQANELIEWFQTSAEPKYRATVMGGVPAGWRTLSRDSRTNNAWAKVYRSYDIISPWTVGRMVDAASTDHFLRNYIEPDTEECLSLGIDYLPVVFPGFSSHNLKPDKPFNEIPRLGGNFLWRQFYNIVKRAGNDMIYIAMFDETDEGTAIFKVAETSDQNPTRGDFLPLDGDEDYPNIPSDWYLRLAGAAGRILKDGNRSITVTVPENP